MTTVPDDTAPDETFGLEVTTGEERDVRVQVRGDLDHETAEELLEAARAHLRSDRPPRHLHLDCARLTLCDSMGLAALLLIHRHALAAGTRLHLDNRPGMLEHLLELTGTLDHFAQAEKGGDDRPAHEDPPPHSAAGSPPPAHPG
ncbi:STAS domain-containing protein [Streptomyces lichenis]|uniref:STAS domain-containing protein n=1 Tax=Streptomyces lichenis TaxID=2306967 RepID=A0ABT0I8V7_9ACTN|nr:STAS domain-containing protein [Streptomyces lichenis]MCK8677767.1 STAS domain-containing protein [Streptomyces lichenis]